MSAPTPRWRTARVAIPALWAFLLFNYIYCDILGLYYAPDLNEILTGELGGVEFTQEVLLGAGILMQVSMVGWLLSNIASRPVARVYAIAAGIITAVVQLASLTFGTENTLHYLYFSAVEVATSIAIIVLAVRWKKPAAGTAAAESVDGELVEA